MKYRVSYPDRSDINVALEAADDRSAAQQFFSQNPRSEDCVIRVLSGGVFGAITDFRTVEFMSDETRQRLEDRARTTVLSGEIPASAAPVDLRATHDPARLARVAAERYRDGYLVARAIDGVGGVVKGVGIAMGILFALVSLLIGSASNFMFGVAGVLLGAAIAAPVIVLGILISAQGQIMKATMDGAVHTSPFLDSNQKATAMSLK